MIIKNANKKPERFIVADGMVDFVIRTKNEEHYIGQAIQSVLDHFGEKTHIVIVDNESTDNTLQNVALFPKRFYNIDIINLPKNSYSPGKSINLGIEKTNSNIIGILSAHCQIQKFDQSKLFSHFGRRDCFGVMGQQIPVYKGKKIHQRYIWQNFLVQDAVVNPLELSGEDRYFFHNAFSFISKNAWNYRQFSEDLHGKEDRFWAGELIKDYNFHFVLDPELTCLHHWTPNGATWVNIG